MSLINQQASDQKKWLERIRSLELGNKVRIMNVCGGHERSISMAGLRGVLPENIELIPGPGCPVCICPEEDVYDAIQLALSEQVTLVAFGDMLRVPVNVPKGQARSLEQARAAGADIRPIASPVEAVKIATESPERQVVFFAAGFETTTTPVAAMLAAGVPDNLSVLLSARLTWPAVSMLLDAETPGFDTLVAPGHVSTVMGADEWQFVARKHRIPTAVAGFTAESLLAAFYSTLRQLQEDKPFLDNCYPEVVSGEGNLAAKQILYDVMEVASTFYQNVLKSPEGQGPRSYLEGRDVTAPGWCWGNSIPINAACMAKPVHRAHPLDLAWSLMKVHVVSGGVAAFVNLQQQKQKIPNKWWCNA